MAANLTMVFTAGESSKSLSVANPKEGLKKADVQAVMQKFIDKKALIVDNQPVDGIKDCYYYEAVTTQLAE